MTARSIQLYSVRESMATDVAGTIARLAELGFVHVEPYGFTNDTSELRSAMNAAGVTAPSGHAAVIDSQSPETVFDAAAELDIRTVIEPYIPDRWTTKDDVTELSDRSNELSELAAQRGLEFGYHNHSWEIANRIDGRRALDVFVDRLAPSVVLEIDTYWAAVGGADAPALLRAYGDRVRLLHVKDGTVDGDISKQVPLGRGEIDVRGVLAAAPQAIRVVEFDTFAGDIFEAIANSLAWLGEND